MRKNYKILYLEDDVRDVELITETLEREYLPCQITWVNGCQAFASALTGGWGYDLIFADFHLPDIQGDQALAMALHHFQDVPFIFISGTLGEERAVECLRNGATDYVLKNNLTRLAPVVRRALEEARQAAARREAEAATSRAVSLLRATLESTSEGILVVDLAGRITTYNRKFMSLCGIPDYVMAPMELERVLLFMLDQFQDPEAFLAEARLLGARPERESFGRLIPPGDRVLEEFSRPHRIGNQTVGRIYTFQDVTARERKVQHLAAVASDSQQLLGAANAVGVVAWCLSEDRLLLSDCAEPLLDLNTGERPRDLAALEALIHPAELDRFRQALERPQGGAFDLRLRKGDTWIWTRWNLARDPAEGYHGVFQDITAQRGSEEACSRHCRALGLAALTDNLSRTLRRLLVDAQGPLELARSASPLPEALAAPLQTTARNLERMGNLLAQLNATLGCTPLSSHPIDLAKELEAFRAQAASTLGAGITLELRLGADLPDLAMSAHHLQTLLLNLCLNARDALQGSGIITLRCSALSVRRDASAQLQLEVQDDGPGIPLCVQSRMFDLFFTTREDALGLGLPVARAIVESYQGSMQLHTAPGQGSTWSLLLPAF